MPLRKEERGNGQRTRVWVEGVAKPVIASRTEATILRGIGQETAVEAPLLEDALDLASRLASAAEEGRVDLADLGRRAGRLLEHRRGINSPAPGTTRGLTAERCAAKRGLPPIPGDLGGRGLAEQAYIVTVSSRFWTGSP